MALAAVGRAAITGVAAKAGVWTARVEQTVEVSDSEDLSVGSRAQPGDREAGHVTAVHSGIREPPGDPGRETRALGLIEQPGVRVRAQSREQRAGLGGGGRCERRSILEATRELFVGRQGRSLSASVVALDATSPERIDVSDPKRRVRWLVAVRGQSGVAPEAKGDRDERRAEDPAGSERHAFVHRPQNGLRPQASSRRVPECTANHGLW